MKPYPEYKDSGVEWLGQIPTHWRMQRTKYLFDERVEKGFPDEPLLAATQTQGVVPKTHYESRTVTAQKDLHLLKLVEPGDYVISLRSFQGGIEYAHYRGIISPAYTILQPSPRATVTRDYFEFFFKSQTFVNSLTLFVTGIREGQNIDYERLSRSPLPVPAADEQAAIGRFLRVALAKASRLIRTKRRLIELLQEQKQAIIHRAVTRGLDPDVRLKPSGVEWLGDIPEHWDMGALRRFWQVIDCKHLTVPFLEEGYPLASVVEVQSFELNLATSKKTDKDWYDNLITGSRKPKCGDVIYCRNASVGASAYVNTSIDFAMGQDVCLLTSKIHNQRYLNYLLHSSVVKQQLGQMQVGSTFKRINVSQIRSFTVIVPPRSEQDKICYELDARCVEVDIAIGSAQREIELIREYRTRLIADVVTGKLDVRGVALPELDEVELEDDAGEAEDDEGDGPGSDEEAEE